VPLRAGPFNEARPGISRPRTAGGGTVASVRDRVIEIVCEQLGQSKDKVNENTSFITDLGADSLDTVELVMELEDEFDLNIPDEEAEKIKTVGDAIKFIEANSSKKE
jgi:acyl carrier protein